MSEAPETLRQYTRRCRKEYIEMLMKRTEFNVQVAARQAGTDRTHIYRLLEQFGIARDKTVR